MTVMVLASSISSVAIEVHVRGNDEYKVFEQKESKHVTCKHKIATNVVSKPFTLGTSVVKSPLVLAVFCFLWFVRFPTFARDFHFILFLFAFFAFLLVPLTAGSIEALFLVLIFNLSINDCLLKEFSLFFCFLKEFSLFFCFLAINDYLLMLVGSTDPYIDLTSRRLINGRTAVALR